MIRSEKMQTYTRLICVNIFRLFSSSPGPSADDYRIIDWKSCEMVLLEKQVKIFRAYKQNDKTLVLSLQHSLVRSFAARALAVREVTEGRESVIKEKTNSSILVDSAWKLKVINELKYSTNRGLRSQKAPKRCSNLRSFLKKEAFLALWNFALTPLVRNAVNPFHFQSLHYGKVCDYILNVKKLCNTAVPEERFGVIVVNIQDFFRQLSKEWLLENILMNKKVLRSLIKTDTFSESFLEDLETKCPLQNHFLWTLSSLVLKDLQKELSTVYCLIQHKNEFVVFYKFEKQLTVRALDVIKGCLTVRGFRLEKISYQVTSFPGQFDLSGFSFKGFLRNDSYGISLQPSQKRFLDLKLKLSFIVKKSKSIEVGLLILRLNQVLIKWFCYYKVILSRKNFNVVYNYLFVILWKALRARYKNIPRKEIVKRHFLKTESTKWVFYGFISNKKKKSVRKIFLHRYSDFFPARSSKS